MAHYEAHAQAVPEVSVDITGGCVLRAWVGLGSIKLLTGRVCTVVPSTESLFVKSVQHAYTPMMACLLCAACMGHDIPALADCKKHSTVNI
jgi:hypothetical protein